MLITNNIESPIIIQCRPKGVKVIHRIRPLIVDAISVTQYLITITTTAVGAAPFDSRMMQIQMCYTLIDFLFIYYSSSGEVTPFGLTRIISINFVVIAYDSRKVDTYSK